MYKKLSLLAVILFSSTWVLAEEKSAEDCGCREIPWQQSFDQAKHVVFGEVKVVKKHSDDLATGDFIPIEAFKGQETHITKLAGSGKTGASCRRVLRQGFYIAYSNDSHSVVLNNCASSRQLREQEDLVTTLTELKKYAETGNSVSVAQSGLAEGKQHTAEPESSVWKIVLVVGILLSLGLAVLFVKKVLPRPNK